MREIEFSADRLTAALLNLSKHEPLCLLDSGGAAHLGSHLFIAGVRPLETQEITGDDALKTLATLDGKFSAADIAHIFTISYDFGLKLQKINARPKEHAAHPEPDVYLAAFDCLIVHDYDARKTYLTGNRHQFAAIEKLLKDCDAPFENKTFESAPVASNFTRESYLQAVEEIQERIRRGDTYQTNLTQQMRVRLPDDLAPAQIFDRLRTNHPAAFAAFIKRKTDSVISASPERFVKFGIQDSGFGIQDSERSATNVSASPIKGTRPRGQTAAEDLSLKNDLLNSAKDRAENVMIVDLLRNDLGAICEFGSVAVEKLCELETHPTLYHLVSTITGELRRNVAFSDVLKAVFPCGSITGAPKISTMRIIDKLETANRGLSMGAIGYSIPDSGFRIQDSGFRIQDSELQKSKIQNPKSKTRHFDLSVAIRTMVVKGGEAVFNVGGGITIDSVPADEYAETLVKARALLNAVNGEFI